MLKNLDLHLTKIQIYIFLVLKTFRSASKKDVDQFLCLKKIQIYI